MVELNIKCDYCGKESGVVYPVQNHSTFEFHMKALGFVELKDYSTACNQCAAELEKKND